MSATEPVLFRADLHCHSSCSDGTASPEELIKLATQKGLHGLAITDHDTIAAYNLLPLTGHPLTLLTGIEFSAYEQGVSVHVLGYSFIPNAPSVLKLCQRHQERRRNRNRAILDRLNAASMPITEEELVQLEVPESHKTIGRPHIALAMVKRGYVATVQEAFRLYIGDGKSCFAMGEQISVTETIRALHEANGFAVLAHPHLISSGAFVNEVMQLPFDGIEGYYGTIHNDRQHQRWIKNAEQKGLFVTGGSDFHGDIKPNIQLGASWTQGVVFKLLEQRLKENLDATR